MPNLILIGAHSSSCPASPGWSYLALLLSAFAVAQTAAPTSTAREAEVEGRHDFSQRRRHWLAGHPQLRARRRHPRRHARPLRGRELRPRAGRRPGLHGLQQDQGRQPRRRVLLHLGRSQGLQGPGNQARARHDRLGVRAGAAPSRQDDDGLQHARTSSPRTASTSWPR